MRSRSLIAPLRSLPRSLHLRSLPSRTPASLLSRRWISASPAPSGAAKADDHHHDDHHADGYEPGGYFLADPNVSLNLLILQMDGSRGVLEDQYANKFIKKALWTMICGHLNEFEWDAISNSWHWWEPLWYFGYIGSFATFFIFQYYSPKKSPQEIAREEAHSRLQQRGESFQYPLPPTCERPRTF
ncbi:hypothetical protein HDV05_004710 [Chytridiales sp. JEL 0842]|nr:hypothetical protein HDV05_004710 [Chytridiales sp. JEL 0842]